MRSSIRFGTFPAAGGLLFEVNPSFRYELRAISLPSRTQSRSTCAPSERTVSSTAPLWQPSRYAVAAIAGVYPHRFHVALVEARYQARSSRLRSRWFPSCRTP